jgi:DMSO/TMAO reductase YedYZ heme-binding membrane subunit
VSFELFVWLVARVAGLTAFAALSISVLSGLSLRTGVLDWLGSNRVLRTLHEYTTVLWMPAGALHIAALLLDHTARIRPLDLLVPFLVPYGGLAIGLGTITFQVFLLVVVTGYLRRRMDGPTWQWLHRLSYVAYGLLFVHALLAGTDAGDPVVAAVTWATAGLVGLLAAARLVWGRLPA